ncbi:MAG TPA: toll/interleukin-1 receptor domain-containing protein [Pyrinomonadaceae bacterium]|jgi:tetratricopeptide (TPR) repeat protein
MTTLEQWLKLAPSPSPLGSDQKWHIFLSYRSVHRPWIIQLYDVLSGLGYKVFLDQLSIAAADPLNDRLEEGLQKSASGILVWSAENEDSNWCKKEYRYMDTRATNEIGRYHYVPVKLDNAKLPPFGETIVYIDFTDCREGPRGEGLLKVLYGLTGKPLPREAVGLATAIDEETKESLAAVKAAAKAGNTAELLNVAKSESLAWLTSPLLGSQVAQSLVNLKKYDDALAVLDKLRERFPKAIRPLQLSGLALAKKGDVKAAQLILGKLYEQGERDPETLGIYARTWMDRYKEDKKRSYLRKSRDLYGEAFKYAPGDYYTGINAAAKSVFLDEIAEGRDYATAVETIVGTEKAENDYWKTATVAEAQLILGRYEKAAELYEDAVAMEPDAIDMHESTWQQAQLLMEKLSPAPEEKSRIASVFSDLSTPGS